MAYCIDLLAPGLLQARGQGRGNLGEGRELIDALHARAAGERIVGVLIDIRELAYLPTAEEAHSLGEWYATFSVACRARIAFLAPPGAEFGVARMVGIIAELRGAAAAVFSDSADALAWLQGQDGTDAGLARWNAS